MLQMATEKQWGQFDRLDPLTVSRSHPDAIIAMTSYSEINSASSAPPYQYHALDRPGIHVVTTSEEIFGGRSSNRLLYMTEYFHNQNPGTANAINLGLRDPLEMVAADPKRAAEMYLAVTGEKIDVATVLRTMTAPGTVFEATPHGTTRFAAFMHRTGVISKLPAGWKDVFFPEAWDLAGD